MNIVYYFSRPTVASRETPLPPKEDEPATSSVSCFYTEQQHKVRADSSDEIKLVVLQILPPKSKIKRLCKLSVATGADRKDTVRIFEVTSAGNTWYLFTRTCPSYSGELSLDTVAFPERDAVTKIRNIFEAGKDIIQCDGYGTTHYNPKFDALWYEDSDCGTAHATAPLLGVCTHIIAEAEASPDMDEEGDTWITVGRIGKPEPDDMDYEEYDRQLQAKYPNFSYEQVSCDRFQVACGLSR